MSPVATGSGMLSQYAPRPDRIALIQHCADEGPGQIRQWAEQRGYQLDVYRSDLDQRPDWRIYRACILLGGPWSALQREELPWLQRLSADLQEHCGLCAFFGICLGAQLLAQALGANIQRLAQPETGWCQVYADAESEPLWVLHWHQEGFALPIGARPWLHNSTWPNQAFHWNGPSGHGRAPIVALQFHPEWQVEQLASFIEHASDCPFSAADLIHQQRFQRLHQWLDQQLDQWLQHSFTD